MGNEVSFCCGTSEAKETQIDFSSDVEKPQDVKSIHSPPDGTNTPIMSNPRPIEAPVERTAEMVMKEQFKEHLEQHGVDVHLILQDRSKLLCLVKIDTLNSLVLLSCHQKVRAIGIRDIKAVLHTPTELKRVETSAGISESDSCAAIHLLGSGNCIPLFFNSKQDKDLFVEVLREMQKEAFENNTTGVYTQSQSQGEDENIPMQYGD